jgi:hypothetical protein
VTSQVPRYIDLLFQALSDRRDLEQSHGNVVTRHTIAPCVHLGKLRNKRVVRNVSLSLFFFFFFFLITWITFCSGSSATWCDTHIHPYLLTYMPVYMHRYIHVYKRTHTQMHTWIHRHTNIHTYLHTVPMYMHAHECYECCKLCRRVCVYIHTYTLLLYSVDVCD